MFHELDVLGGIMSPISDLETSALHGDGVTIASVIRGAPLARMRPSR